MKINKIVSLIIMLVTVCLLPQCKEPQKGLSCTEFDTSFGEILLKHQEDTVLLLKELDNLLRSENCLRAHLTRADFYFAIDSVQKAEESYRAVLQSDSAVTYALYKMGLINQYKEKQDSAVFFLKAALKAKQIDQVIIDYPNSNNLWSTDKNKYDVDKELIFYRLGVSHYYLKNFAVSLEYFNQCMDLKSMLNQIHLYRGAVFFELGDKKKACDDFLFAKRLGNLNAEYYINKHCLR